MEILGKSAAPSGTLLIHPQLLRGDSISNLSRCMALARRWPYSKQVRFVLCQNAPKLARKRILASGFECQWIEPVGDSRRRIAALNRIVGLIRPAAVVLAGGSLSTTDRTALQRLATDVICLDAPEFACHPKLYIDEFSDLESTKKKVAATARRIAVMAHGNDSKGWITRALKVLESITRPQLSIDIYCESDSPAHQWLDELNSNSRHSIRRHNKRSNLHALLHKFDLGIVNFGPGCLQLACHGIPMLAIAERQNNGSMQASFRSAQAISIVDADVSDQELAQAIRAISRDREQRRQLVKAAQRLVDGAGADRIINSIIETHNDLRKAS